MPATGSGSVVRGRVAALAAGLFVFGFGQELWFRFVPAYLRHLGATPLGVGAFGTLKDLLDAAYALPGGVLTDRIGSRRALLLFAVLTAAGFGLYLAWPSVPGLFTGLFLVMAWPAFGLPATFTLVGEELARERRIAGFTLQAVLKRLPVVVAPPLGGLLLEKFGMRNGMRIGFAVSLVLGVAMWAALARAFRRGADEAPRISRAAPPLPPALRTLLAADILVRLCEGLPDVFVVVWVLEVVGLSPSRFGVLTSILMATAIVSYAPAVALAGRAEKKSFIVLTYAFFTAFPLAVLLSRSFGALAVAFAIGGLREIGEPARKAFIVDASPAASRGRVVGLYYALRGFSVAGAAAVGGLLWSIQPELTFLVATALGLLGTIGAALFLPVARAAAKDC
jgi:MFS family permease